MGNGEGKEEDKRGRETGRKEKGKVGGKWEEQGEDEEWKGMGRK